MVIMLPAEGFSFINLMLNKYTSYIPTVLEHFGPQASYWKRKLPVIAEKVEELVLIQDASVWDFSWKSSHRKYFLQVHKFSLRVIIPPNLHIYI